MSRGPRVIFGVSMIAATVAWCHWTSSLQPSAVERAAAGERVYVCATDERTVNSRDGAGMTLAMWAAWDDDASRIRQLVNGGKVNLAAESFNGQTALMIAVERGHSAAALALLEGGASVNQQTSRRTAVHSAATSGQAALIELLATYHAELDARDPSGQTPLMRIATLPASADVARALLRYGANASLVDLSGRTALDHALEAGDADLAYVLRNPPAVHLASALPRARRISDLRD